MEIEKPFVDQREYHLLSLDNGLEVLLISDEKTDKSSA
jgi:secreted Zn-dependent insulinase-like peptidase